MTVPVLLMLVHDASGVRSVIQQDPKTPQVSILDLGVTRGDGIFESIGVVDGRPQALEPHLARLAKSARMLDLPAPDLDAWRDAVLRGIELADPLTGGAATIADHETGAQLETGAGAETTPSELLVKLVLTRGIEGSDAPTGWVHVFDAGHYPHDRAGIAVVTLDRGYRSDVAETSPWLLQGAKTLSYAVNKAALREATRRGADDVIFVSIDGIVLEGPNSTVVALIDGTYVTTPSDLGVLEGTTQAAFFADIESRGGKTAYRALTVDELRGADAIWLASSGRQIAPVVTLDGAPVAQDPAFTPAALDRMLAR